jgi:hypothetical protein
MSIVLICFFKIICKGAAAVSAGASILYAGRKEKVQFYVAYNSSSEQHKLTIDTAVFAYILFIARSLLLLVAYSLTMRF